MERKTREQKMQEEADELKQLTPEGRFLVMRHNGAFLWNRLGWEDFKKDYPSRIGEFEILWECNDYAEGLEFVRYLDSQGAFGKGKLHSGHDYQPDSLTYIKNYPSLFLYELWSTSDEEYLNDMERESPGITEKALKWIESRKR